MPNKQFGPNKSKPDKTTTQDRLAPIYPPPQPLLILLSGLSGAGKDTVLAGLRQAGSAFYFSVSATTRKPRSGEKEGADYFFVTKKKFQQMIEKNEFIEWANVYGNLYGRQKEPIRQALKQGRDVIVRLDVQGAATYKKLLPDAIAIFMTTETIAELEKRLKKRRTESAAELQIRVKAAEKELKQLKVFDYIIVNRENELERTIGEVQAVIAAEKCRVSPRQIKL